VAKSDWTQLLRFFAFSWRLWFDEAFVAERRGLNGGSGKNAGDGKSRRLLVKSEPLRLTVQPGAMPVSNIWTVAGLVLLLAGAGIYRQYRFH